MEGRRGEEEGEGRLAFGLNIYIRPEAHGVTPLASILAYSRLS